MAKDINLIQISGNLVADPEMRYTKSDTPVANLRIASNRPFKDSDDEWDEAATFVSITAWQNLAERVAEAFGKGDRVIVTGRLDLDEWETDDGENRSMLKITADNVQPMGRWGDFLDSEEEEPKRSRSNGKSRNGKSKSKRNGRSGSRRPKGRSDDGMDVDDIPF